VVAPVFPASGLFFGRDLSEAELRCHRLFWGEPLETHRIQPGPGQECRLLPMNFSDYKNLVAPKKKASPLAGRGLYILPGSMARQLLLYRAIFDH